MSSKDLVWDLWPSNIINTGLFWLQLTCFTKCWINSKRGSVFTHTHFRSILVLFLVGHGLLNINDAFLFFLLKIIMGGVKWPVALQAHKTMVVIPFSPLVIDETQYFMTCYHVHYCYASFIAVMNLVRFKMMLIKYNL